MSQVYLQDWNFVYRHVSVIDIVVKDCFRRKWISRVPADFHQTMASSLMFLAWPDPLEGFTVMLGVADFANKK